jgi:transcriptional regulator with XRE-family HTH domain
MASHDAKIARAMAALARNMQRLRAAKGLSQQGAADLAGLHWRHWQKIEAGAINVTVASLAKVAAALDVNVGALFAPPPKQ